jgi:ribosome-associated protein
MLTPKEIAYEVTKALDAKKGIDIKLLKIDKVSSLADYFLICTGTSNTHVKTLCDYAEYTLEQLGEPMLGREGHRGNSWELLDYGTIVVHVFTEEAREFYSLERLWGDAEVVDLSGIVMPD